MPDGISPEEKRRLQEQERRYQKAEKEARAAWQRGLENEREAAEALQEEKKTHLGKRRVSFDSSRNQTYLLYSQSPQLDPTPAQSTDAGEPFEELLSERYRLLVKEIASLRSGFAELEFLEIKEAEEEALARKVQAHEAARLEQERHRKKAEEEALRTKEAKESVFALIQREGEAARRKDEEAWKEQKRLRQMAEQKALKAAEAEKKVLARVKLEYEARKEQERCRQMEKEKIVWKRDLENERPSTSQAHPWKPEQSPYPLRPSGQQHPPTMEYPTIDHSHLKHYQHGHPSPRQAPSASSVPVGLSGLPAVSLCSDLAPDVTCYGDKGRDRSDYAGTFGSKEKEHLHQECFSSAPRPNWSTPSVPVGLSGMPAGSLCSDEAPEVARYKDEGRGRSGYTKAYGSKHQEPSHRNRLRSAPSSDWSMPPVPAWKSPTLEPQVIKQTLVIPAQRSCYAGVETPKEQWPLPPTPAPSNNEPQVPTRLESEQEKLQRELREEKRKFDQGIARLRAEVERKGQGHGASSVASWQTGCKSVWEDPTKVAPENTANDSSRDVAKAVLKDVAVQTGNITPENDTRKSPWERGTEGHGRDSNVDYNGRSLSRTTKYTRQYEAEDLSPSNDNRTERLSKAHVRAKSLKLKLPVGTNPPYVPPTPYWHPSFPPSLPPIPSKRSSVPGPAVAILPLSTLDKQNDQYGDLKTPMPPGSCVHNYYPLAAEKKVNPAKY
ncbi:hypothetical protein NEUTE1DRAFT_82244 [Neurospora tetrasperma FGSC 2508]|uniref:Uncharacterized protein n=1 Tax=Neurospora tetrasperma (strain FGSC 2508 / ATCC MYA-4615 / P0657) TaxID=510951 RepID=F8MNA2_NEUT8|nr:uncharacterized protein NEUTE1DRAFT_82244 [Neurospora tetrasperma FGSC 2508]EGO58072.1 hypothetical protein NEUTE1DRAFT_82244 [Neurospora tetrasperma FGSC 2508]EGZ71619.1 hypothetical protein NEUTE2DRAFT_110399 [Neurospora tetrasperma FGSC 2509]